MFNTNVCYFLQCTYFALGSKLSKAMDFFRPCFRKKVHIIANLTTQCKRVYWNKVLDME